MTVTVQILNEDAMALLLDLEKLNVLKLLLPEAKAATIVKVKKKRATNPIPSNPTSLLPEQPISSADEKFKPGFGGAKNLISLSPDWDEPLSELQEYIN